MTQELRLSGNNGRFKYVIGGYYFYEDHSVDTRAPFSEALLGAPAADKNNYVQFYNAGGWEKTNAYAGFGQVDAEIVSGLTLSVGLRYSKEYKDMTEFATVDFTTPYDPSKSIQTHIMSERLLALRALLHKQRIILSP